MTSEVRRYSTGGPNSPQSTYTMRFHHFDYDKHIIAKMAAQLNQYAPAVINGINPEYHLNALLKHLEGQSAFTIHKQTDAGLELVGAVTIIPRFVEYPHLLGKVIHTDFILVKPGYNSACRKLIRQVARELKGWGCEWMTVSRPVSDTDVITRFMRL